MNNFISWQDNLPPNVKFYPVWKRIPTDHYPLQIGYTHVFEFRIKPLSFTELAFAMVGEEGQDFSIEMSISEKPLNDFLFTKYTSFNFIHLSRPVQTVQIWDQLMVSPYDKKRLNLSADKSYFINLKNLQNKPNGYILRFSY